MVLAIASAWLFLYFTKQKSLTNQAQLPEKIETKINEASNEDSYMKIVSTEGYNCEECRKYLSSLDQEARINDFRNRNKYGELSLLELNNWLIFQEDNKIYAYDSKDDKFLLILDFASIKSFPGTLEKNKTYCLNSQVGSRFCKNYHITTADNKLFILAYSSASGETDAEYGPSFYVDLPITISADVKFLDYGLENNTEEAFNKMFLVEENNDSGCEPDVSVREIEKNTYKIGEKMGPFGLFTGFNKKGSEFLGFSSKGIVLFETEEEQIVLPEGFEGGIECPVYTVKKILLLNYDNHKVLVLFDNQKILSELELFVAKVYSQKHEKVFMLSGGNFYIFDVKNEKLINLGQAPIAKSNSSYWSNEIDENGDFVTFKITERNIDKQKEEYLGNYCTKIDLNNNTITEKYKKCE